MVAALQSIAGQQPGSQHRLAESLQRKLNHIEQNGKRSHPDPTPTVMTEDEINDYFATGRVELPQGVTARELSSAFFVDIRAVYAGGNSLNSRFRRAGVGMRARSM